MHALTAVDRALLLMLNHAGTGHMAAGAVRLLAALGGRGIIWLILFALVFLLGGRRGRRLALTGVAALALADVLAQFVFKGLAERPSPATTLGGVLHVLGTVPAGFSFPSAQAAMAAAAAAMLARLGPAWTVGGWLLALAISIGRVAAGIRFPSDALGGVLIGLAASRLAVWALGEPLRRIRRGVRPGAP